MTDLWIILTGIFVAISCALPGCFLILRNLSMVGDAISHAVLPGIVIAYLMTGSKDTIAMFIGAGLLGLLTTFLIEFFHQKASLQTDAAIGVVFTFLFSIGVVLISLYTQYLNLDQHTVLYGEIAFIPFDTWSIGKLNMGPIPTWIMGGITILITTVIITGFKELQITSFDSFLATSLGLSAILWHYILMGMVSIVSVASFKSVGAVLVLAFIVGPPATAYLVSDKLPKMLFFAAFYGSIAAISGYYIALLFNSSISGSMAFAIGLEFFAVLVYKNIQNKVRAYKYLNQKLSKSL